MKKKLVSARDLKKARKICAEKGGNLSDILVNMKAVSRDDLLTTLSEEFGFPPITLSRLKIDKEVLGLIPKKIASAYQMIPISRVEKQLTVAMADPLNILTLDDLKLITQLDISPVIASEEDIREAIDRFYETKADDEILSLISDIKDLEMELVTEKEKPDSFSSSEELLKITEETPIVKLANLIISTAVKERASDILIEPMEGRSRVRYRIDGILSERYEPPKKFHPSLISRFKVMSNLDIAERRLPQDGRFKIKIEARQIDFRISIVPSSFGEKAALRILDKNQAMIDINSLGFREPDKQKICLASQKPHGMILVCGPTGCGKTTTLYSVLKHIDTPSKNIVTVEDPVEYELKGINQVTINEEIGLTFAAALRSILRQDPDVIMVGEIRDFETLDVAIKSALTGHLVLSTLHTNTASASIVRMINMGVEPFLISASVELIVAQRLLRKLCPECKEAYIPSEKSAEKYGLFNKKGEISQIYKAGGCKKCKKSGYKGRVGIVECLGITSAVKELIFKGAQEFEIERTARAEGMSTLRENAIKNVVEGIVSLEDVLTVTVESSSQEK
ncbi:MAG: ATPase, T2SS/T4P/T4SS family [Candidatus Omnitrophota bacterium]